MNPAPSIQAVSSPEAKPFVESGRFRRNLLLMTLFSLPVIYLGILLAVCLHEAAGHGLAAILAGGKFDGFGLAVDGLGWARVDLAGLPARSVALVLLAGALASSVFSLVCFGFQRIFRKRRLAAMTFLFLAITALLDGLPYFFWDAVKLGGIGDFSGIWSLYPHEALRALTIGLTGATMGLAIVWFNLSYYKLSHAWLGEGKRVRPGDRVLFTLAILLLQATGWFSFDWNQLVPGIGLWPGLAGTGLARLTLLPLAIRWEPASAPAPPPGRHSLGRPIAAAWILAAGAVFVIVQWLQKGAGVF